jgi:hypothetical protein
VKTSEAAPYRRRLLTRVLASTVLVATTLTVIAGTGTAGATTSPTGKVTVCHGGLVAGKVRFSVNGGASFALGVYQCATKTVPAGENLVTELLDPTKATDLWWIAVRPMSANVVHKVKNSKSQAGYAKVNVVSGADVEVGFVDQSVVPALMVCPVAEDLDGQYFNFTEQAGDTTVGPFSVQAGTLDDAPLNCGKPTTYPAGTEVTVSELGVPNVNVSVSGNVNGITVSGSNGQCGEGRTAVVPVGNKGMTVVYFMNSDACGPPNPGYLEMCLQGSVGPGPWTFTISGNNQSPMSESVQAGECSGDVALPVGNYTVTESLSSPDSVSAITGTPIVPVSTDLGSWSGVFAVTAGTAETATFTDAS